MEDKHQPRPVVDVGQINLDELVAEVARRMEKQTGKPSALREVVALINRATSGKKTITTGYLATALPAIWIKVYFEGDPERALSHIAMLVTHHHDAIALAGVAAGALIHIFRRAAK